MSTATELSIRMRALADSGHERADELRAKALEFDEKTWATLKPDAGLAQTKGMLGAWARARRLWSECTGEPLI